MEISKENIKWLNELADEFEKQVNRKKEYALMNRVAILLKAVFSTTVFVPVLDKGHNMNQQL